MKISINTLDRRLLLAMGLLTFMGLLTIFSAGRGSASQGHLWMKQAGWMVMGFIAMVAVAHMNPARLFRTSVIFYALGILGLLAVFAIGKKLGGAQRWIMLGGLTFQPSELMKWLALLFVAHRLGTKPPTDIRTWELFGIAGLVFFPMLLVLKQPDLGMAISFLPILLLIPLIRGLKAKWVVLGVILVSLLGVLAWKKVLKPYQKQRVMTFLNPEADLRGKGYQINQSRIAIGAGGLLGKGFTSGTQTQLNFLPVKTTDFVFSVWAEERGFLGVLIALGLFGLLLNRILEIGRAARKASEVYFCVGAAGIFALHIFVNVGMVIGILPNKGMVLPFFSAGGSSTVSYFLALGVVMGIHRRSLGQ